MMRATRLLVAALVTASLLTVSVPSVAASCLDDLNQQSNGFEVHDPGTRLPVIMVHGWQSSATVWDDLVSVIGSVGASEFLAPVRFDYSHVATEWVTDPDIGPKLGVWVDCLADTSAQNGGPGKVALVGHSMGGLAIREALGLDAERNDKVAFVGTLGTPNLGSPLGGSATIGMDGLVAAVTEAPELAATSLVLAPLAEFIGAFMSSPAKTALGARSSELTALPELGGGFPVWASAGNIVLEKRVLFWTDRQPVGDVVVGKDSATVAARADGGFGGEDVLDCLVQTSIAGVPGIDFLASAAFVWWQIDAYAGNCIHTQLPHADYFTSDLIAQLVATHSWLSRPPSDEELAEAIGCVDCVVSGTVEFDHPSWGPSTLVTLDDGSFPNGYALNAGIVVVSGRNVVWTWTAEEDWGGLYELQPWPDPIDALGRIFIKWNPGRYDGTMILEPIPGGFDDFGTAPWYGPRLGGGSGGELFYGTHPIDQDGDGVFEIYETEHHPADCWVSDGIVWCGPVTYKWNGSSYALIEPVNRVDLNDPQSVAEAFLVEWTAQRDGGMFVLGGHGNRESWEYYVQNPPDSTALECWEGRSLWECGPAGSEQYAFIIFVSGPDGDGGYYVSDVLSP